MVASVSYDRKKREFVYSGDIQNYVHGDLEELKQRQAAKVEHAEAKYKREEEKGTYRLKENELTLVNRLSLAKASSIMEENKF